MFFSLNLKAGTFKIIDPLIGHPLFPLIGASLFMTVTYVVPQLYINRNHVCERIREAASFVLDKLNLVSHTNVKFLRNTFRGLVAPPEPRPLGDHTHPLSAAYRSSARNVAKLFASKTGLDVVVYQSSRSDADDGDVSCIRKYYWHKDVNARYSNHIITPRDLILVVDTDYYVEMPEFLLNHDNPVFIYSFQPRTLTCSTGEYSFTFNKNNEFTYTVSGGAHYQHAVWNYGDDVVVVSNWISCASYVIERKAVDKHHEFILLVPLGRWNFIGTLISKVFLQPNELKQMSFIDGDFGVVDYQTSDGMYRCIARIGSHNNTCINKELYDAIETSWRVSTTTPGVASVASWLKKEDTHDSRVNATVLCDYLRQKLRKPAPVAYPAIYGIRAYQCIKQPSDFQADAKNLMVSFMSPLYPSSFVPDRTVNNEQSSIYGRVMKPQKDARALQKLSPFLTSCMIDFVRELIPPDIKHTGIPVEIDEVYKRQKRPTQVAGLQRVENFDDIDDLCKSFMKAEVYTKCSDPRMITTFPTSTKRDYGRFIYALADYCEKFNWYAFGKVPKDIAELVAQICVNSTAVACTDAHRWDGHITEIGRELELMILVAYFANCYHESLTEQHTKQYKRRVRTQLGEYYELEYQRGSGSMETALFNTVLNKFCDYYARRLNGDTSFEAFIAPGIFGGDDSLASEIHLGNFYFQRAAADFGQDFEVVIFIRGQDGVNFLSRIFTSNVWTGGTANTCDLPRMLCKLHVSVNSRDPPVVKLRQKLLGLCKLIISLL